jgi:hypothetical protein
MFFLYILFENFTILNDLVPHVGFCLLKKRFFRKFAVGENWKKLLSSEGVVATLF